MVSDCGGPCPPRKEITFMGQLYTIGHSTYQPEHILTLLKENNINYVLDVRSNPHSKYASQFNKEVFSKTLEQVDITYAPMGKYFGARQPDKQYYPNGYLDFELFRDSSLFKTGIENVLLGLKSYNIALMCTEKHPFDCHRAIMVARGFELVGVDVKHILHDGSIMTQAALNQKLLEHYYPDHNQLSIFDGQDKSEEDCLLEAYRLRNKEIGYYINDSKKGV